MKLVVRTWNVYHGRTWPETRQLQLERMVRLVTADTPDLVCLQELPLWSLPALERWSGMDAGAAPTKRALAGPFARWLQQLAPRHVRSALTGQANAILVARRHELRRIRAERLNPGSSREPRVCQLADVVIDGAEVLVANLHATAGDGAATAAELDRVRALVEGSARAIVCGDFNLPGAGLAGFSPPLPGIDQVLVRGLELLEPPAPWPDERRSLGAAVLLSDHAPVEAEMILP